MRIYLASRYSRRPELCHYAEQLRALGHTIASRWLNGNHQIDDAGLSVEAKASERTRLATEDWEDLMSAHWCVSFTEAARPERLRRFPRPGELEIWRAVPDSRLGYEVSSFGRVRNGDGETILGKKVGGYFRVKPSGRTGPSVGVHAIVATSFIGPPPSGHEVDHLDGFKDNNWFGNLEYVTHPENVRRASERMRGGPHAGARNGRAKLSYDDVAEIRARAAAGDMKVSIARDFDVSDTLVGHIVSGKLWPVDEDSGRGGRHCEFGGAVATGKRCVIVGCRENIFHYLSIVEHFDTWEEFVAAEIAEVFANA